MTKEDLIKKAYGKYYPQLSGSIDENGWSNNWNHFASVETRLFAKEDTEQSKGKWRLKSLQGIEDNNGWVKIESKKDLPINTTFLECISKAFDFKDPRSQCTHHYTAGDKEYMLRNYSHYRIIPFNPPVF